MNLKINTFVLKGFDSDQSLYINKTIDYLSSVQEIDNTVNSIENLNLKLSQEDFLILLIDELLLDQIIQNKSNKEFFLKKEFRNNQIILILDDIDLQNLPEYLQYFQTFSLNSSINYSDDENIEWNKTENSNSKLFEVLNDIIQFIKRVKTSTPKENLTIYIGPSDDNTTLEYQKITRELLHRDFNITPEISNPSAKEIIDNVDYFQSLLQSADLSIHFVGHKSLLDYPEKKSSALKVNEIAANFCKTSEGELLQRIVYVPAENANTNELLSQKILQFKSDTKSLLNAELIQTPIEKFKEVVLQKLHELSKPFTQHSHIEDIADDIYIIYPPGNEDNIKIYADWFEKNKIPYSKSQVDLDQLELLNYHQKKLTTCKGVLIFDSGNTQWLKRKLSDIKKSPGWGRKKPFEFKAISGLKPELIAKNTDNSFLKISDIKNLESSNIKELLKD